MDGSLKLTDRKYRDVFLTVKELSQLLKIKASTLYAWVAQGKIPFYKTIGLIRFSSEEISEWLASKAHRDRQPIPLNLAGNGPGTLDALIARAKREVYNPRHGETRPRSSLNRKEGDNGAL